MSDSDSVLRALRGAGFTTGVVGTAGLPLYLRAAAAQSTSRALLAKNTEVRRRVRLRLWRLQQVRPARAPQPPAS